VNREICNNCGKCAQVCYTEAIRLLGQEMTIEALLSEVKKDTIAYKHSQGGITISGGEPLLDPGFTLELLQAFKEENISVGVDTCGHVPWTNIEKVLPCIDFFLWDIKHMDDQKHREFTGASNKLTLSNLRSVSERNVPLYIRVPVIPGYNDSEDNIRATCEFVCELSSLVEVNLLPLHHLGKARYDALDRDYPITEVPLIPDDVLQNIKRLVESYQLHCSIIG
jgi:pyruvate formate lyase activating enzyme